LRELIVAFRLIEFIYRSFVHPHFLRDSNYVVKQAVLLGLNNSPIVCESSDPQTQTLGSPTLQKQLCIVLDQSQYARGNAWAERRPLTHFDRDPASVSLVPYDKRKLLSGPLAVLALVVKKFGSSAEFVGVKAPAGALPQTPGFSEA